MIISCFYLLVNLLKQGLEHWKHRMSNDRFSNNKTTIACL